MTLEELGRYVVANYPSLVRFVRSKGLTAHDAEDVVQQSLVRLVPASADIDARRPDGFIFTAVRHAIVDHWRKRGRQLAAVPLPEHLPSSDLPDVIVSEDDPNARCREVLAEVVVGLSPRERRAFAAFWKHRGERTAALAQLGLVEASQTERYRVYDGPLHHARRKLTLALQTHAVVLADVGYFRLWGLLNELLNGLSPDADLET
jgi:hypothetical protein